MLVIIGILIALSINNWNELRKSNIEEIAILKNLEDNLVLASQLSESQLGDEERLKKVLIYVLEIEPDNYQSNIDFISDKVFEEAIWDLEFSIPIINAYTDLKNTNKLSLIKDQTIKERFTSLEVSLNQLESMLNDRLNVHQIRIDDVVENDINFIPLLKSSIPVINIEREKKNNYDEILKQQRIRNLLGIKLALTQDVISYRKRLDKEIKELRTLISSELSKRS